MVPKLYQLNFRKNIFYLISLFCAMILISLSFIVTASNEKLSISCEKCKIQKNCRCEITNGSCSDGLWILTGTPLKYPMVENLPPNEVIYKPIEKGKIKVIAFCFQPSPPRVERSIVSINEIEEPFFECEEICTVGGDCTCTLKNCKFGKFTVKNKQGSPVKSIISDINNCEKCTKKFTPSGPGMVEAMDICLNPFKYLTEKIKIKEQLTTTTLQPTESKSEEIIKNTSANQVTFIGSVKTDTNLKLNVSQDVEANITITRFSRNPAKKDFSLPNLGKYIRIKTNKKLTNVLNTVFLQIGYTDKELRNSNLSENNLAVYRYDEATKKWRELNGSISWVNSTGTNSKKNYVWTEMTHFSLYTVGEKITTKTTTSTSYSTTTSSTTTSTSSSTTTTTKNCLTCYPDNDGDNYYAETGSTYCNVSTCPGGMQSSPGKDCCDKDEDVHPNRHGEGFKTPSVCGTWDYNCNGKVEKSTDCVTKDLCGYSGYDHKCSEVTEYCWAGNVPDCGNSGQMLMDCDEKFDYYSFTCYETPQTCH